MVSCVHLPSHPCQDEGAKHFFKFLSVVAPDDSSEVCFTFGSVYGQTESLDRALLRTQLTVAHTWMDGFKSMPYAKIQTIAAGGLKSIEFANQSGIARCDVETNSRQLLGGRWK